MWFLPLCEWDLRYSGMLWIVDRYLSTSRDNVFLPAIQYQAMQRFFFGSLVREDGADSLSRNIGSRLEWKRNVTAQAQKPDSVFQRNGRVHLYRRGCQFSGVLAFLECGSAENDCSNTGWTVPCQAEDCWLPTPFASFPFTSPPVRRRVPPDSVSTLPVNAAQRPKRTDTSRLKISAPSAFESGWREIFLTDRFTFAARSSGYGIFTWNIQVARTCWHHVFVLILFKKNAVLLCQGACTVQSCTRVEYTCLTHVSSRHLRMPNWLLFFFRWWCRSFVSRASLRCKKLSCIRTPAVSPRFVTLFNR